MSAATITETKKMTTEEKKALVLSFLGTNGVTITEVKDHIDGHAGRTALLFTAMCRSGLLTKTEDKREGKLIYVEGNGKPSSIKKVVKAKKTPKSRKKVVKVLNKTHRQAIGSKNSTSKKTTQELDSAVEKARISGAAVGANLMEAKRQVDAFIEGLRSSLNG